MSYELNDLYPIEKYFKDTWEIIEGLSDEEFESFWKQLESNTNKTWTTALDSQWTADYLHFNQDGSIMKDPIDSIPNLIEQFDYYKDITNNIIVKSLDISTSLNESLKPINSKDWNRMIDLYLNGKDSESIARKIKNKDKAAARFVAGIKLYQRNIEKSTWNGELYGGVYREFGNRAIELGATEEEIQELFDNSDASEYLELLRNKQGKKLDNRFVSSISKTVLDLGLDIEYLKTNGNAITAEGRDAMSGNGRKWTIGYKTEIDLGDHKVDFIFDAITDEGDGPSKYIASSSSAQIFSKLYYITPLGQREFNKVLSEILSNEIKVEDITLKEFGPISGSGNSEYNTSDLAEEVSDLEVKIWNSSDNESVNKWEIYTNNIFNEDVEYWSEVSEYEIVDAIKYARDLLSTDKLTESISDSDIQRFEEILVRDKGYGATPYTPQFIIELYEGPINNQYIAKVVAESKVENASKYNVSYIEFVDSHETLSDFKEILDWEYNKEKEDFELIFTEDSLLESYNVSEDEPDIYDIFRDGNHFVNDLINKRVYPEEYNLYYYAFGLDDKAIIDRLVLDKEQLSSKENYTIYFNSDSLTESNDKSIETDKDKFTQLVHDLSDIEMNMLLDFRGINMTRNENSLKALEKVFQENGWMNDKGEFTVSDEWQNQLVDKIL